MNVDDPQSSTNPNPQDIMSPTDVQDENVIADEAAGAVPNDNVSDNSLPPVIGQTTWTPAEPPATFGQAKPVEKLASPPILTQVEIDEPEPGLSPSISTEDTPQDTAVQSASPEENQPVGPASLSPDYKPAEAEQPGGLVSSGESQVEPADYDLSSYTQQPETTPPLSSGYQEYQAPEEVAQPTVDSQPIEEEPALKSKLPIILLPLLVLLLIGGAIFAYLKLKPSASGTSSTTKKPSVTLTYWGLWEPDTVMSPILDEYKQLHPEISINYQFQSKQEYRERLQSANAKGSGPDIFRYHISWVPMLKNELEPVPTSVISASDFANNYYPVMNQHLKLGNSILGIPLEVDTLALFYNEDIFQKAGKTPPTSWNEVRPLARDLVVYDETGKIKTAGIAMGSTVNVDHWSDILGLLLLQNGADPSNPTTSNANDALTFFSYFVKEDKVWDETMPSSTLAFATGKAAMYLGFSWDVFEIKNINPQLQFKVIPVPQAGGAEINWASFWVEGVNKNSKNKQAAWEFLKFLSSKETMQKLYQNQSTVRLFGEPYPRPDMASLVAGNSMITPFLSQAATAKTWYLCSRTYDNGLNDKMIKYYEDALNAVIKGTDATTALKTTASGITQLSTQYSLGTVTSQSTSP